MHIKITSENVGVRRLYEADIMSGHYEPPGIAFSNESRTANVVAEVGEALCERYDWLEPADADAAESDSAGSAEETSAGSQASPDDSDGDTAGDEED